MWNQSVLKDGFRKSPTGKLVNSFTGQKSRTKNKNESKKNVTEAPNNKSDEEPYKDFSGSITAKVFQISKYIMVFIASRLRGKFRRTD